MAATAGRRSGAPALPQRARPRRRRLRPLPGRPPAAARASRAATVTPSSSCPGLLADDVSTRALRTVLRKLGYDVHGWGLGRNIGPTAPCVNGMRDLLDHLTDTLRQAGHA